MPAELPFQARFARPGVTSEASPAAKAIESTFHPLRRLCQQLVLQSALLPRVGAWAHQFVLVAGARESNILTRADERRSARSKVLLRAAIERDDARFPVRVINFSAHGALVAGEAMPSEDEAATLRCGGWHATGWIVWVRDPHAAVNFDAPIKPHAVARKIGAEANLITKDNRKLDYRGPGFRDNQMSAEERQIVEAWHRAQREADRENRTD